MTGTFASFRFLSFGMKRLIFDLNRSARPYAGYNSQNRNLALLGQQVHSLNSSESAGLARFSAGPAGAIRGAGNVLNRG